ncbi:MAG TPA: GWxTD domain-containing protein [Thermoanaerobaculia bacterium]|nr:GWxTD domain-containing protein [Thermoanaerobaculia bacterium]
MTVTMTTTTTATTTPATTASLRRSFPLAAALAALLVAGCASAPAAAAANFAELEKAVDVTLYSNFRLSPEYSGWLVGPIAVMATEEEEAEYLALGDDEAAAAFIEDFWERRKPYPARPDNPLREEFDVRANVADRLYTEGTRLGRRTARGTIYVLYGKPTNTDYEIAPDRRDPSIEVWLYDAKKVEGIDGSKPDRRYRFIRRQSDDFTDFYRRRTGIERARPVRPGQR